MVVVTYTLNIADTAALNQFDDVAYMAFGSNNTTPIVGNTTLGTELLRVKILPENITKNTSENYYEFTAFIPITQLNSSTVREVGLFELSSGGTMAMRIISPVEITKTSSEEILYTIKIKINTKNS